jgi:hypothetical protein
LKSIDRNKALDKDGLLEFKFSFVDEEKTILGPLFYGCGFIADLVAYDLDEEFIENQIL